MTVGLNTHSVDIMQMQLSWLRAFFFDQLFNSQSWKHKPTCCELDFVTSLERLSTSWRGAVILGWTIPLRLVGCFPHSSFSLQETDASVNQNVTFISCDLKCSRGAVIRLQSLLAFVLSSECVLTFVNIIPAHNSNTLTPGPSQRCVNEIRWTKRSKVTVRNL